MAVLLVTAALILLTGPGGAGASAIQESDNPLPLALRDGARRGQLARRLRQLRRARRAGRQLLLDHLRLLAPAVRAVPGRLPAAVALGDQRAQDPEPGADRARHDRLPARRDHPGRRTADQHRGLRRDRLLRADDAVAHRPAAEREPDLPRPYRTPGGVATTGVALVLAIAAVVARPSSSTRWPPAGPRQCSWSRWPTSGSTAGTTWSPTPPEEEFAAIQQAEAELH